MLDTRTFELINADLDRELGPDEAVELDALLDSSSEAREMKSELLKMTNILEGLPKLTPPADLSEQILQQIKLPRRTVKQLLGNLFSSFQPATAGLAFAAGLLLTVSVYELSPRNASVGDLASMVGTMVADNQSSPSRQIDTFSIEHSELSGSVSLRESKGVLLVDFDLDSKQEVEIELGLVEDGLSFAGIAQTARLQDNVNESYVVSGGTLRVVNHGRQTFTVFLRRAAKVEGREGISIGFSSGGEQVFHGILRG